MFPSELIVGTFSILLDLMAQSLSNGADLNTQNALETYALGADDPATTKCFPNSVYSYFYSKTTVFHKLTAGFVLLLQLVLYAVIIFASSSDYTTITGEDGNNEIKLIPVMIKQFEGDGCDAKEGGMSSYSINSTAWEEKTVYCERTPDDAWQFILAECVLGIFLYSDVVEAVHVFSKNPLISIFIIFEATAASIAGIFLIRSADQGIANVILSAIAVGFIHDIDEVLKHATDRMKWNCCRFFGIFGCFVYCILLVMFFAFIGFDAI